MENENLFISISFDKSAFPKKYTCDGEDISPPIQIDRIQSPYIAIIIDDWIGPDERFNHWLIWDIESRSSIPENIPRAGVISEPFMAIQGTNDFGTTGYRGPCPPSGEVHTYYFNVYGLDAKLGIPPGSKRDAVMNAMKGHMIQYGGQALATYNR
ncbi:YbhB/YbcL family Raf kinase inhibitor-like protein [Methanoregula sp.]|jgi:Raf kinase inhibitor-like YbhB/YbcL family protein|uniref:YbhB/YbcL family Raf kinase inhibitor-like protein n=1 Tax=Methanoregula sp. TaxID=2052170 RepID=UPI003C22A15B